MFYLPGWAFYSAVIGVGLTFICAVISGQAEKSTASDKVQDKMNEGKTLICLAWNEKNWGNCISSSRSMPFLEYPHHDFLCQKSENAKLYSFLSDPLDERTKGKKKKKKEEIYRGTKLRFIEDQGRWFFFTELLNFCSDEEYYLSQKWICAN